MPRDVFLIGVLIFVLILSAVIDYRLKKIPNLITYPTMALAVSYHTLTNGVSGLYFSLTGLATGVALLIIPYILGGMGAGDAKLLGAIGAGIGPSQVFVAFLYSATVGGIYALLLIILMHHRFREVARRRWTQLKIFMVTHRFEPIPAHPDEKAAPKLCYGIAISIGTIVHIFLALEGYQLITL
jgi:prepilin peptidase CpaA